MLAVFSSFPDSQLIALGLDSDCYLLRPWNPKFDFDDHDLRLIVGSHLAVRLSKHKTRDNPVEQLVSRATILQFLPRVVDLWGKAKLGVDGDIVHASEVRSRPEDGRDASYVRVSLFDAPLVGAHNI